MVVVTDVIPMEPDTAGVVRVGGTRVTLDTIIAVLKDGATAEKIVHQYPSLALADVYSVIGYYLRHSDGVAECLQQRKAQADAVRKQNEMRFNPHGVRDRLLVRLAKTIA